MTALWDRWHNDYFIRKGTTTQELFHTFAIAGETLIDESIDAE